MNIDISKVVIKGKYEVTFNGKTIDVSKPIVQRGKLIAFALENLIARDGAKCRRCGGEKFLSIEHIVPEFLLKQFFATLEELYTDLDNLELLCRFCNAAKGGSLDFSNPKTKVILLKYIEKI